MKGRTITIDVGHDIPVYSKVCTFCVHLIPSGSGVRACHAFADIPMEIWMGQNAHIDPYPGDHGIQFEPVSPVLGQ